MLVRNMDKHEPRSQGTQCSWAALSFFKLYIQHWTTELKRITAGSCWTLNLVPCTRCQGHETVIHVDPCLMWYITRPTEDDPSYWRYSTTSSLCTTWPPGPWARMDVKQSELPKNSLSQSILPLPTFLSLQGDIPRTTASSPGSPTWTWMIIAEDGFFKALSEITNWVSKSLDETVSWAKHDSNVLTPEKLAKMKWHRSLRDPKLIPVDNHKAVKIALDDSMEISGRACSATIKCTEMIKYFAQFQSSLASWPRLWMLFPDKLHNENPDDPVCTQHHISEAEHFKGSMLLSLLPKILLGVETWNCLGHSKEARKVSRRPLSPTCTRAPKRSANSRFAIPCTRKMWNQSNMIHSGMIRPYTLGFSAGLKVSSWSQAGCQVWRTADWTSSHVVPPSTWRPSAQNHWREAWTEKHPCMPHAQPTFFIDR